MNRRKKLYSKGQMVLSNHGRRARVVSLEVAEHLPEISDESGKVWELHVDVETLQTTFLSISRAA